MLLHSLESHTDVIFMTIQYLQRMLSRLSKKDIVCLNDPRG